MRLALVAISVLLPLGCDDRGRAAKEKKVERESTEREAKRKAVHDAERNVMKTPSLAVPEIERRLSGWLTVDNGVLIVRDANNHQVHALPAASPWLVTCGRLGIEIRLGHWFELEPSRYEGAGPITNELVTGQLTTIALTEEECRLLVSAVGQKMLALLGR